MKIMKIIKRNSQLHQANPNNENETKIRNTTTVKSETNPYLVYRAITIPRVLTMTMPETNPIHNALHVQAMSPQAMLLQPVLGVKECEFNHSRCIKYYDTKGFLLIVYYNNLNLGNLNIVIIETMIYDSYTVV